MVGINQKKRHGVVRFMRIWHRVFFDDEGGVRELMYGEGEVKREGAAGKAQIAGGTADAGINLNAGVGTMLMMNRWGGESQCGRKEKEQIKKL